MSFRVGQRVEKIPCGVPCSSKDCGGINHGSRGSVHAVMDKNRTSVLWDNREATWWVWNHGLSSAFASKLYTEL